MATKSKPRGKRRWGSAVESQKEIHEKKRRALIIEAGRSFRRSGYHNTSLDDVAKELNVSKPALYYYVKNKSEILFECISKALDLGDEALALAKEKGRTPLEELELFIRRYIVLICEAHGAASVLTEFMSLDPEHREVIGKRRRAFDRTFRAMVQAGIDAGDLPPQNPKMAVFFFMGTINSITRWYLPEGDLSGEDIADAFGGLIMGGLKSPSGRSRRGARGAERHAAQ